ncbi:hypothetical protein ACMFMF_011270 [Clarireedia jacksonii]
MAIKDFVSVKRSFTDVTYIGVVLDSFAIVILSYTTLQVPPEMTSWESMLAYQEQATELLDLRNVHKVPREHLHEIFMHFRTLCSSHHPGIIAEDSLQHSGAHRVQIECIMALIE